MKSKAISTKELYLKYKEEHPESNIQYVQFRKLINFSLDGFLSQIIEGRVLNMGHRIGLLFVRKNRRRFEVYTVDKISSSKNKEGIYGCEECEFRFNEDKKIPSCKISGRNIFSTVCVKSPTLAKGKNSNNGIPWVVPYTSDHYYAFVWQQSNSKLANKYFYRFKTDPAVSKAISEKELKEVKYNNK